MTSLFLIPRPLLLPKKIFELAPNDTGVTAIVRYLKDKKIPTPIQYSRSNGLLGNLIMAAGTGIVDYPD